MNQQKCACCADGHTPGIVSCNQQQNGALYQPQAAIRYGTVYPELNKPLHCAPAPTGCAVPDALQTMGFSAWDVRLYLDTHPQDASALQMYRQFCSQMDTQNYACAFVPCSSSHWAWVEDPWPWEYDANGRRA